MKILVTGGNGFIGSHLCEALISSGHQVDIVDLKINKNTDHINCPKFVMDIYEKNKLPEISQDKDLIIHLAAVSRVDDAQINPIRCYNSNVIGTLNILEAIKNSDTKLIFSSSREVYGEPNKVPVLEMDDKNPLTVYGSSKLAGEQLIKTYHKLYDVDFVTLRFANVYGSLRDLPQRVIPKFVDSCLNNKSLTINGGNQVIDFTFIDDVINGILNLVTDIDSGKENHFGEDYNFASGTGTSVIDLAKLIKSIFNSNSELIFNKERDYDVKKFIGNSDKAKRDLSFLPEHKLQQGLTLLKERSNY